MTQIILLICCLLSGYFLRRSSLFDERSPIVLNHLIVYFFIPIITLYHVPKISFEWNLIWLSVTPFIIYLSSFLFFKFMRTFISYDKNTEGALIMTSGIGSTSFVGFPIFEILYGAEGLALGIVLSLAGTILVFNTAGISTGLYYAKESRDIKSILKKMLTFPPFLAFVIALIINGLHVDVPEVFDAVLQKLAAPFSVLALLAIGMQIDFSFDRTFLKAIAIGQIHKLILAPLIIYLLMWHILDLQNIVAKICILGAAIGSMNSISIIAAQLGLNPKLATAMPAIGIPISVPILFLIDKFLL